MPILMAFLPDNLFGLLVAAAFLAGLAFLISSAQRLASQPFRWLERARMLLTVIEAGLERGGGAERAIIELSRRREQSLGAEFHLLAAHLEKGLPLGEALDKVPGLLPANILCVLKVGLHIRNLPRVLPAARRLLDESSRAQRESVGDVSFMAAATTIVLIGISWLLSVAVLPKFEELFMAYEVAIPFPALASVLIGHRDAWFMGLFLWLAFIAAASCFYLSGPQSAAWLDNRFPWLTRRVTNHFPWQRRRMQRDYSLMLALLLDAGVPEETAVSTAAHLSGGSFWQPRSDLVVADLREGIWLPEAVRHLDDSGEMQWRAQFSRAQLKPLLPALAGLHESLEAQAFRLERMACDSTNLLFILGCGAGVGVVCVVMFNLLISLMEGVMLW
jgi:type II secretory pathway component PulF